MKVKNYSVIMLILLISFVITGCSVKSKEAAQCGMEVSTSKASNCEMTNAPKVFTLDELAKYNGQNGKASYIAVNSVVYDVTSYNKWQEEQIFDSYKEKIAAGKDLSQYVTNSDSETNFFDSVPRMGALKKR